MMIRLQYFSRLRELNGPLTLELPTNATVGDALSALESQLPLLSDWNGKILLAVGIEFARHDQILHENDLLSLMPPVQGG